MQKSFIVIAVSFAFHSFVFSSSYRRVFHGHDAEENEFPYMVNVRAARTTCGGGLLNRKYVITAAHCLMDLVEGQPITVILGDRNFHTYKRNNVIKLHGVMKYWMHEGFSMPSAENDLAIIELSQPVEYSENIKPLNISKDALVDKAGDKVVAVLTGWGLKEGYEPAKILQAAEMKLIPIDDCMKFQEHYSEKITKNHLCGIGLKNEPKRPVSACDGDSGAT